MLLCGCPNLRAASFSTPIQSCTSALAVGIELYSKNNGGKLPPDWKSLDMALLKIEHSKYYINENRSDSFITIENILKGSVEDNFILVYGNDIKMARPNPYEFFDGGKIIAITTSPISDSRHEAHGRYVIWESNEKKISYSWLDETIVEKLFNAKAVALPLGELDEQPIAPYIAFDRETKAFFKDPKHPTADETANFEKFLVKKYSDEHTDKQPVKNQIQAKLLPTSEPKKKNINITLWLILSALVIGASMSIIFTRRNRLRKKNSP